MKKVAFIATGYIVKYDGVSVYTENLLREFLSLKRDDLLLDVYVSKSAKDLFVKRVFDGGVPKSAEMISIKDSGALAKIIDLQKRVLFKRDYDLVFIPNPMPLFFTSGKRVKVIHDLTIKRTPKLFSKKMHIYIDFLVFCMKYFDDALGYISDQTKGDICRFYNVKPQQKEMLYLPNGIPFKVMQNARVDMKEIYKKYEQKRIKFIVVGRINRSKGFDRLLKFLKYFDLYLQKSDFESVVVHVVGKQTHETKSILEGCSFKNIVLDFLGYTDDETLNDLYKKSHFCFFLSRNEGYGLPLVESMWFGAIAIVSDIEVFNEILTSRYPKFDDQSGYEEAIKEFIEKIYNDRNYLSFIFGLINEAVEREKSGYKKAAQNLLNYLYEN